MTSFLFRGTLWKGNLIRLLFSVLLFSTVNSLAAQTLDHQLDSLKKNIAKTSGKDQISAKLDLAGQFLADQKYYDSCYLYCMDALRLAIEAKDGALIARSYYVKGFYHRNKFQTDSTVECFMKSLKYYEKVNDSKQIAELSSSIADVYLFKKNYSEAIEKYKKSLVIQLYRKDSSAISTAYSAIASVYYYQDSLTVALFYFQKSYDISLSIKEIAGAAILVNNMASVYNDLKQYDKAIENYGLALKSFSDLKDSINMGMCYANLGNVYNELGKPEEGIRYSKQGLAIALKGNNPDMLSSIYNFLYEGYEKLGDYKNAFVYLKKMQSIDSLIYDQTSNQNIADMRGKYDSDKKENENNILKKDGEIKDLTNARLSYIIYLTLGGLLIIGVFAFFLFKGSKQKQKANLILEQKNNIISEQNKDILDSIKYAKRIQEAILPTKAFLQEFESSMFIFYKPKDIVSGDFYWIEKKENKLLLAAVDCTGHGVPGAFMSIVGHNLLNQAVVEHRLTQPSLILDEINKGVTATLRQSEEESTVKDGMDIALCSIDRKTNQLEYAGAYNPVWIVRGKELIELRPNKFPIGTFIGEKLNIFTNHTFQLEKNDMLYLFTDGYADQFGGPDGKKFKYKEFQKNLVTNAGKSVEVQKEALESVFNDWRGKLFQVDDILVIGIRI